MNLNVNVLANFCVFSRITTSCYLCRKIVIDHFLQYYDVVNIIRERWLETYLTIQAKVVNKELLRLGTIPATVVKQVRSQKTQNEWTFITYDMAHEGSQADTFYEGDEKRSKLKMQAASARDVIRRSRETERITHETEQEQKEQE